MPARLRGLLLRVGAAAAAGAIVYVALQTWVVGAGATFHVAVGGRPVELLAPAWLYLAALCPLFFLVRSYSLTDVSIPQQLLSSTVRSLLLCGIAVALARPVWTTRDDRVATAVLVDVSSSISDKQLDAARRYVTELERARGERDRLYVVTFAERPRLARREGGAWQVDRHPGADHGTNMQAALQLAYGLFPPGFLPRIVIVGDGLETDGDLAVEAYRARELGVRVSWMTFEADRTEEIRIAAIDLPDELKVGAPFDVVGEIWSTHDDEVTVSLYQDEFPNAREPKKVIKLHEGVNRVVFTSEAHQAGHTTYRMRLVSPKRDTETANNEAVLTAPVKGRPRVLYVEGGVLRDSSSASYLQRALEHENIDVEVRGPRGLPSTAKELERFDLVLVSDVPAHFMGLAQMQAIESYVRDLGGGFIMAGGEDSFGSGGYQGTRIEKILPVRFDAERIREQPNIALVLVIDRSGSMSGPKLEAAKASAQATADAMAPSDLIGVIAFDNQPNTIVRLQRASNRTRITADIRRLSAGGGTNIYPALQEAYQWLQSVQAKVKHVILLSDGQAPYDGIAEVCQEMRAARITVSAVGIGDADKNLLNLIADNGDGRLYMTEDLGSLPRIFVRETTEAQKSALVEDLIKVHVAKRAEMIEGTDMDNAPFLRGYVSTRPKKDGEVVLVSDLGEPILARWRLGLGTAVAWTSDVKNRWSVDWIRWSGYPKFWAQVIRTSMRRKIHESYDMFATVADGHAQAVVDAIDNDDQFVDGLETTLEVYDPRDPKPKRVIPMDQTAAGRYTADVPIDRYGTFLLKAVHRRDGRVVAESMGSAALSYPAELLRSTPDTTVLAHAAGITQGTDRIPPAEAFDANGESIPYAQDLWPYVLLAVACALLVDLYLKRVRLFGYRKMPL